MSFFPIVLTALAIGVAAYAGGPIAILWLDFATVNLPLGDWQLGPVSFDPSDLVLGACVASLALARPGWRPVLAIPYLRLWLLLGVLISVSYLLAPANRSHLNAPHEVVYQLYRYGWKQILFYPLAMLLLANPARMRATLLWIGGAAVLLALQAIPEGYAGVRMRAAGPFTSGNALGGALAPALVVCTAIYLAPGSRWVRAFGAIGTLLVLRALIFSGSRGALIASLFGLLVLGIQALAIPEFRRRMLRVGAVGAACLGVLLLLDPGLIADAPSLDRFRGGGTEDSTLDWRMEERWPHFAGLVAQHPWLGAGLAMDPALGESGATPHNGFLALAVLYGVPVPVLFLVFAGMALLTPVRLWMHRAPVHLRLLCAVPSAALAAVLLHNLVDSIVVLPYGGRYFWTFVAFCIAVDRVAVLASARSRAPGRSWVPAGAGAA